MFYGPSYRAGGADSPPPAGQPPLTLSHVSMQVHAWLVDGVRSHGGDSAAARRRTICPSTARVRRQMDARQRSPVRLRYVAATGALHTQDRSPQLIHCVPDIYFLRSCSLPNFITIPSPITIQFVVDVFVLYVILYLLLYCLLCYLVLWPLSWINSTTCDDRSWICNAPLRLTACEHRRRQLWGTAARAPRPRLPTISFFSVNFTPAQSRIAAFVRLPVQIYFVLCFSGCCRSIAVRE